MKKVNIETRERERGALPLPDNSLPARPRFTYADFGSAERASPRETIMGVNDASQITVTFSRTLRKFQNCDFSNPQSYVFIAKGVTRRTFSDLEHRWIWQRGQKGLKIRENLVDKKRSREGMEQDEQCTALSHFRLILSSGELARRRTSACETSPFIFAYADQLPSVDKNRPGRPVSKRERGSSMPNTRARVLCLAATQPVRSNSEPAHQNAERHIG